MASSSHSNSQKAAAQTTYTNLATVVSAAKAANANTLAAAAAADRLDLQLVITREGGTALT